MLLCLSMSFERLEMVLTSFFPVVKAPATPTSPRYVPAFAAPIAKESNFAPRGKILETIDKRFRKRPEVVLYGDSGYG